MTNPFDAPTSSLAEEDYRHPANPGSYRPGDPSEPREPVRRPELKDSPQQRTPYLTHWPYTPVTT